MNFKIIKLAFLLLKLSFLTGTICYGQDTIYVNEKNINTKVLREGTHRYLVYFKRTQNSPRSQTQFWTRTIGRSYRDGRATIKIDQQWEFKDTVLHTDVHYSVLRSWHRRAI